MILNIYLHVLKEGAGHVSYSLSFITTHTCNLIMHTSDKMWVKFEARFATRGI